MEQTHDWDKMVKNVQMHIKGLNRGYKSDLMKLKVKYFNSYATFTDPHTISLDNGKGKVGFTEKMNYIEEKVRDVGVAVGTIISPKRRKRSKPIIIDKKIPSKFKKILKNRLQKYNLLMLPFSASEKNKSINTANFYLKKFASPTFSINFKSLICSSKNLTQDELAVKFLSRRICSLFSSSW